MPVSTTVNSTIVLNFLRMALLRLGLQVGGLVAPHATALRAARLFSTPSARARERAQQEIVIDAQMRHLHDDGETLAVYEWGDPATQPYVLLSHGWSSYALRFQPLIAPLRAAGYAVVAFDQIGHGRSGGRTSTMPQFARQLLRVASAYGEAAAVIGHSMGGAAAAIAMTDGLRARRAVLIAPAADLRAALHRFATLVGIPRCLFNRVRDLVETQAQVRFDSMLMHPRVRRISQPALIVHDLHDREVPWDEGERYARYWPDSRLLTTSGLGHHRIVADADVIAAMLRFLAGDSVGERVVSTTNLPYGLA